MYYLTNKLALIIYTQKLVLGLNLTKFILKEIN